VNGGCPGAGDDSYRRYIEDDEVDKVEVDGAGLDTAEVNSGDVDHPEVDSIERRSSAHDGGDDNRDSAGITSAASSACSGPA